MKNIIVIGGGAAGMIAAIAASEQNNHVILIEKNEKLGKKVYITGKGRCNITNACDREDFFKNIVRNSRFLYSSFDGFSNWDIYSSLEEWGLSLKIERGERVFPESDKSSDVIRTLSDKLKKNGVEIHLNTKVTGIETKDVDGTLVFDCVKTDKGIIKGDCCIVCTGGLSYPSTGSDGDGYRFAKKIGHIVTKLYPSLVAFRIAEDIPGRLQGISLKNVSASIYDEEDLTLKKPLYSEFGEMLFTHFGVSGPIMLSASAELADKLDNNKQLFIDFKPALSEKQLDDRLLKCLDENRNKSFKNSVSGFLPARLLEIVIEQSKVSADKSCSQVTKSDRERFISVMKGLKLTITGTMGYNEAIITKGGISVKEINPKTMESKLAKNLYFAGEILDLDAYTGGFNLQIAWSTGYAAGKYAGE